jgi:hypothetical protein
MCVIEIKGMAKSEKEPNSPSSIEITAPKAIEPLMHAFHADSEEAVRFLIKESFKAIEHHEARFATYSKRDKEELEGIRSLMKGLNPCGTLETLYAAQIVASHMLGMRKILSSYPDDQKLALRLLRFSNEIIQQLQRKRSGGPKNLTVNYN